MANFRQPYFSKSIPEFWRRWHISLSTWFRDYVYIPMGGNRHGTGRTYFNLFVTFLISGIWHGAAWTFAVWGILHAMGVMITRELERSKLYRERVPRLAKQVGVFAFVCFAWIFFRAESLADALFIVNRIFTASWQNPEIPALMVGLTLLVWLYQMAYESRWRPLLASGLVRVAIAAGMVIYMCLFSSGGGSFIYFQF